jgi:hypothetical protein
MYRSTFSWPRHLMEVSGQLHAPVALPLGERAPGIHWIGGWVNPRVGLDDWEKIKFLHLPRLEFRPLCRPARSQSLYRLRYPGSSVHEDKHWLNYSRGYELTEWQLVWEFTYKYGYKFTIVHLTLYQCNGCNMWRQDRPSHLDTYKRSFDNQFIWREIYVSYHHGYCILTAVIYIREEESI